MPTSVCSVLAEALPWLKKQGIWSRGRFGSYKYEVANQDHRYDHGGAFEAFLMHPLCGSCGPVLSLYGGLDACPHARVYVSFLSLTPFTVLACVSLPSTD